ncbi:uncharacterized protein [Amphiura filiformis]|uniref:uncharacterized protein n=1 Tax=Amphiura filiformis TaxID=82378 RepID=UPI003B2190E9
MAAQNGQVQDGQSKMTEDPAYPPPYNQGPSVNMAPYPPQTQAETNLAYQSDHQLAAKYGQTPHQEPNTVVIVRTTEPTRDVRSLPPPSPCLAYSIISMLFCCLFGIIATVYSVQSLQEIRQARSRQARDASSRAVKWATAAYAIGILTTVLCVILYFTGVLRVSYSYYSYSSHTETCIPTIINGREYGCN